MQASLRGTRKQMFAHFGRVYLSFRPFGHVHHFSLTPEIEFLFKHAMHVMRSTKN